MESGCMAPRVVLVSVLDGCEWSALQPGKEPPGPAG